MADYKVSDTELGGIADKIRAKGGTSALLEFPTGFENAIDAIQTGITPTGTKNISTNGTHDVTNYASANVAVPASAVDTGTKNINSNGTHNIVGYASAAVNVPNTYSQSDEGKVVSNGALVAQTSDTVTQNGTVDTTLIDELTVNVSGGGGGATVIASGTFAGNNAYKITVPLGKKMAQTDFVFVMYLPDETEIPYVNDGNSVLITNAYVCIPKQISKIDLSTDNDNIQFKGGYVYNINNAGTITRMNKGGTVAASAEIQGTSSAWGIFGNGTNPGNTMVTMKRDSSGFAMKLNRNAWQSQFKRGFTYNWQVVYIGNDPTNDIVEVP